MVVEVGSIAHEAFLTHLFVDTRGIDRLVDSDCYTWVRNGIDIHGGNEWRIRAQGDDWTIGVVSWPRCEEL
jgi:hypothetical protein